MGLRQQSVALAEPRGDGCRAGRRGGGGAWLALILVKEVLRPMTPPVPTILRVGVRCRDVGAWQIGRVRSQGRVLHGCW